MKYDKYQELVDYVTVVGPADDKKRSYKYKSFQIRYPFAACEILSLDNSNTIEFFFPDNSLEIEEKIVEEVEVEEESVKKAAIDGKSTAVMTIMTDGTLDRNVKIIIVVCRILDYRSWIWEQQKCS